MRWRIISFLGLAVLIVDQATKYAVNATLSFDTVIPLTSFFNLVHTRNRGAAFGFLNDPSIGWQTGFFLATTLVALSVIFFLAWKAKPEDKLLFWALGSISGGALGNAVDRVYYGEVIDFLDIHWKGWHWPAFNVADIGICVGAGLIILTMFLQPKAAITPQPEKR